MRTKDFVYILKKAVLYLLFIFYHRMTIFPQSAIVCEKLSVTAMYFSPETVPLLSCICRIIECERQSAGSRHHHGYCISVS